MLIQVQGLFYLEKKLSAALRPCFCAQEVGKKKKKRSVYLKKSESPSSAVLTQSPHYHILRTTPKIYVSVFKSADLIIKLFFCAALRCSSSRAKTKPVFWATRPTTAASRRTWRERSVWLCVHTWSCWRRTAWPNWDWGSLWTLTR